MIKMKTSNLQANIIIISKNITSVLNVPTLPFVLLRFSKRITKAVDFLLTENNLCIIRGEISGSII